MVGGSGGSAGSDIDAASVVVEASACAHNSWRKGDIKNKSTTNKQCKECGHVKQWKEDEFACMQSTCTQEVHTCRLC